MSRYRAENDKKKQLKSFWNKQKHNVFRVEVYFQHKKMVFSTPKEKKTIKLKNCRFWICRNGESTTTTETRRRMSSCLSQMCLSPACLAAPRTLSPECTTTLYPEANQSRPTPSEGKSGTTSKRCSYYKSFITRTNRSLAAFFNLVRSIWHG